MDGRFTKGIRFLFFSFSHEIFVTKTTRRSSNRHDEHVRCQTRHIVDGLHMEMDPTGWQSILTQTSSERCQVRIGRSETKQGMENECVEILSIEMHLQKAENL